MSKTSENAATASAKTPGPDADALQWNLLTGHMVQAMRQSLGATLAELAKASGVSCQSIEATEQGKATTPAERHAISAGFAWLLNNPRVRKRADE